MKLYVIRHGQTTGDVEDRFGGAYDDYLTEEGENQAEGMAKELKTRGIQKIIHSDLSRARRTASVLKFHTGATLIEDSRLRERDQYGKFSGELKADYPDVKAAAEDRFYTGEGGETYEDFSARICQAFADISNTDETVAIVWHGGGMRVLFRDILKMGGLSSIGDCGWVELRRVGGKWVSADYTRMKFEF